MRCRHLPRHRRPETAGQGSGCRRRSTTDRSLRQIAPAGARGRGQAGGPHRDRRRRAGTDEDDRWRHCCRFVPIPTSPSKNTATTKSRPRIPGMLLKLARGGPAFHHQLDRRQQSRCLQGGDPTATIGIRGTDHEPVFIPEPKPGETPVGQPGTYDKVNSGRDDDPQPGSAISTSSPGRSVSLPMTRAFAPASRQAFRSSSAARPEGRTRAARGPKEIGDNKLLARPCYDRRSTRPTSGRSAQRHLEDGAHARRPSSSLPRRCRRRRSSMPRNNAPAASGDDDLAARDHDGAAAGNHAAADYHDNPANDDADRPDDDRCARPDDPAAANAQPDADAETDRSDSSEVAPGRRPCHETRKPDHPDRRDRRTARRSAGFAQSGEAAQVIFTNDN